MLKEQTKNLSLLYLEDDIDVRDSTNLIFQELFKEVIIGVDGKEGLSLYSEYKDTTGSYIDLIISDINMPNIDGIGLSKEILKINPNQKLVIVSGYSESEYFIELIKIGVSGFIKKPFSLKDIFDTLYKVSSEICEHIRVNSCIELEKGFKWDKEFKILFQNEKRVPLTKNEINLMTLLMTNINKVFTDSDIFNYIYYDNPEKEFSSDVVKGLLKRLRKKIPKNLIQNNPKLGYNINKYL